MDSSYRVWMARGRIPLLGHTPWLLSKPIRFLQNLRRHGDIVQIYLGPQPAYVLNSPRLIHQMLVTDVDKFDRGRIFDKARLLLGNGLSTTDGAFHRQQRKIMQPAFHLNRIAHYAEVMREQIGHHISAWQPGVPMAWSKEMTELALGVVAKSLFNANISSERIAEVRESLPIVVDGVMKRVLAPDFWGKLPTKGNRRFNAARLRLREIVDDIVVPYYRDRSDHGDLLSMLVSARYEDSGEPMSPAQIRDEVITILMAGTETTMTTLSWLFYELAQNPQMQQRVHDEIASKLDGRPIAFADLPTLDYTARVIDETLRRHCALWLLYRRTTTRVSLGGVSLPENSPVLYSFATLHRDPTLYPEPLRFNPDRWLSEQKKDQTLGSFVPFGIGRHKCIGDHFARTEIAIAVATIVARWRLSLASDQKVREVPSGTLRPSSFFLAVTPR